ncbi:hypothetical protein ACNQUF_12360 [Corynebacterium diphtheriae]
MRVSSAEQNLDRQLEAVGECDRIFQDKISGSSRAKRRHGCPLGGSPAFGQRTAWRAPYGRTHG